MKLKFNFNKDRARQMRSHLFSFLLRLLFLISFTLTLVTAQESPYFVTYDHHMEEPGNLEIATSTTVGTPRAGEHAYFAPYAELEYGVTGKWTSELYLEGQGTSGQGGLFTGWRLENRYRPLAREHVINPVLYLEYESINEASRIQKEVVGNSTDFNEPIAEAGAVKAHELEAKLILSSTVRDWNIAENFIVEKNLSENEGFEFGYAFGAYRSLATLASAAKCRFCRENFSAGFEMYGGLGTTNGFGLHDTSHYFAPIVSWQVSDNATLRFSTGIGLTQGSSPVLMRFSYSYEVRGFGRKMAALFGARP
jgi:hypothetical protein